jgi:hypothetical protein
MPWIWTTNHYYHCYCINRISYINSAEPWCNAVYFILCRSHEITSWCYKPCIDGSERSEAAEIYTDYSRHTTWAEYSTFFHWAQGSLGKSVNYYPTHTSQHFIRFTPLYTHHTPPYTNRYTHKHTKIRNPQNATEACACPRLHRLDGLDFHGTACDC